MFIVNDDFAIGKHHCTSVEMIDLILHLDATVPGHGK